VSAGDTAAFRSSWKESVSELTDYLELVFAQPPTVRHHWPFDISKIEDPAAVVGQTMFHLAHQGENDADFMVLLEGLYRAACTDDNFAELARKGGEREKKRVGFVSSLLRDHSIGRMMVPILQHLAHAENLEIVAVGPGYVRAKSSSAVEAGSRRGSRKEERGRPKRAGCGRSGLHWGLEGARARRRRGCCYSYPSLVGSLEEEGAAAILSVSRGLARRGIRC
jgi:hypothetical protein